MLACKTFEVRDAATFIPAVGVLCDPERDDAASEADRYLLGRAGYGTARCILFTRLDGHGSNIAPYDPVDWGRNRTMRTAHEYVSKFWDTLTSGDVIDVELILGLTDVPKASERYADGGRRGG